ncbi:MAG: hypothetical protein WD751_02430 [Anaerolineales bacterium]
MLKNPKSGAAQRLRAFTLLAALEAMGAIGLIFSAPSEGSSAWLLGLSPARWLLLAALLVIAASFAVLYWLNLKGHKVWQSIEKRILAAVAHPVLYAVIIGAALLLSVLSFYLCILTYKFTDEFVHAWLLRLFPALAWLLLFSLQTLVFAPLLRASKSEAFNIKAWLPGGYALVVIAAVALFMWGTGLGLQPDRAGWDTPGVPLLATQVLLASFGAGLLYLLLIFIERRFGWQLSRVDLIAAFVLWVLAIWIWQAQSLTPTFFSPTPRAPNFEYYPQSDAATHDLSAQSLLVGEGFNDVIEKPLYSFFLAILHTLAGQGYLNVVAVQIVVLALFPAILFLLGSQLHHRLTGLLLALAVILREQNAIALSGDINVSHSKLLMTDLPAALGMALLTLLVLRWFQADRRDLRWPLWVGGALGLLLLLRSQTLIFLPVALILAFCQAGKILRIRLQYAGLLLLGFLLAALPWMFRNYQYTGQFGYSQPLQALYLAKQYSLTPELGDPGFPEGTPVSDYVSLGFSKVAQFTLTYPGEVARFVVAHFFHNEVSALLALPMRFDLTDKIVTFYNLRPYWLGAEDRLWSECCSLDTYVSDTPYWQNWDGQIPNDAWLPLAFNLTVVAIGVGAAWRKTGWLVLVPLGVHVLYNLSTAVARVSGWRLILPVDWVLTLFYCAGLAQLTLWGWSYLFESRQAKAEKRARPRPTSRRQQRLPQWAAAILLAGLLLPVAELAVPARFPVLDAATAQAQWETSDLAQMTGLNLQGFLGQPGAKAIWGRALYPRFYATGVGESGGESASNPLPFSRMAFRVVGPMRDQVALPLAAPPGFFPNAVDVLVLGCSEETYFRAAAVVFLNYEGQDLLADNSDAFICADSENFQ